MINQISKTFLPLFLVFAIASYSQKNDRSYEEFAGSMKKEIWGWEENREDVAWD